MEPIKPHYVWAFVSVALLACCIVAGIFIFGSTGEKQPFTVGIVMSGAKDDDGWNLQHYVGLLEACSENGVRLLVEEHVAENTADAADASRRLVENGAQVIVLSGYSFLGGAYEYIWSHPEIAFYAKSTEYTLPNVTAFYGRIYQARYLAGMLAGAYTRSGSIGYVAAMPVAEVNRGIAAFALGVQRVNPAARVHVAWTNAWRDDEKEKQNTQTLVSQCGADIIAYQQDNDNVAKAAQQAGVACIGYNLKSPAVRQYCLAEITFDWKKIYLALLKHAAQTGRNKADSLWPGMECGVVDMKCSEKLVPESVRARIHEAREKMRRGEQLVFTGEIYDSTGKLRCRDNEYISDRHLFRYFDWHPANVDFVNP